MPQFSNFKPETFLRDHWQRAPLLIRGAFDVWRNPLEPDELAGLACEEGVDSRLVLRGADEWRLEHGPFAPDRFAALGAEPWTLLVQEVDQHVPGVAALLEPFRFLPEWRVDDVMVSYASDGGGVGPHFDQYDVFLVQGLGRRRWQVGGLCDEATALLPHEELRLLAQFEPAEEWVLEPGDILYLPPRVAHRGEAVGDDCMTYSIGFRAPSRHDLLAGWSEAVLDRLGEDERYTDPALSVRDHPGEITPAALARLHALATKGLMDGEGFSRWFGETSTSPRGAEIDWAPEQPIGAEGVRAALGGGAALLRNPAIRFAFVRDGASAVWLFVAGERFRCDGPVAALAEDLCRARRVMLGAGIAQSGEAVVLLARLIDAGWAAFED